MIKVILSTLIFFSTTFSSCQQKPKYNENEFDNGSRISSITLSKYKTADIVLVGQIWGFLKYYHPSVATGTYNWDYELFKILPEVINSKSEDERNKILSNWIKTLGELSPSGQNNTHKLIIKIEPDLTWIDKTVLGEKLTTQLNAIRNAKRADEHFYLGLAPGVGNPQFKNENSYSNMNYPDVGFRLLSLYRYWNMINYYFPYKNLIGEDWNKVMNEFIPKFIDAKDELEYKLTVLSLIGRIHDTHANIWGMDSTLYKFRGQRYSPLEITFIENKAIVADYIDSQKGEATGIRIGDVIKNIDGKLVTEIVEEKLGLTPASNYPTKLRDIARNLLRTNKTSLSISYWNGIENITKEVETFSPNGINLYAKYQKKDTCFKMINSEIAYLYPGSIKNDYLPKIMSEVQNARGLIIDFRCYPSDFIVFSLSSYLLPKAKSFVKFSNGSIAMPGLFTMTDEIKVGRDNSDFYKGKIVIIVNELTQSSAEYHTMAFRTAPNSIVIGSTTAGADGNVSKIVLPGGIETMISGIGVYYPDGKETQRIGIVPDIEVKPTVKGIRERRDELIERAIKIINGE